MTYPAGMMPSTALLISTLTASIDALQVGKWIKEQFGLRSNVTAVFMTHAVINDTLGVRAITATVQIPLS